MITEDQRESIISDLVSDGMKKSAAEKWVGDFDEWFSSFSSGNLDVAPKEYAQYWIDEVMFPAGYGTTIFARQGTGKTNLLVYMMQSAMVLHSNWVFLHTIPFPKVVSELIGRRFRQIKSAREMMLNII
ncbi:MAG: hypothetical protein QXU98_05780, partial [Candidatus Parvarchaeota archaeon]